MAACHSRWRSFIKFRKRTYLLIALLLALTLTGAGAILADDVGSKVAPGEIDDGGELLGQVTITLQDAIAAARAAEDGARAVDRGHGRRGGLD